MNSILSTQEARTLARPIGSAVSDTKIQSYINEVEMAHIASVLGDDLFLRLHDTTERATEPLATLLSGGTYTDSCGKQRVFAGLKTTIAYGTYSKLIQTGDVESTRYGMVVKRGEYSEHISQATISKVVGEVAEIEHAYLADCVAYCKAKGLIKCHKRTDGAYVGGVMIQKIG